MPDFVEIGDVLRGRLDSFTPSAGAALPRYWPNGETEPTLDLAPSGYVYSEIAGQTDDQICLGGLGAREFRSRGEFVIWVCVPRGSRAGFAENYAQELREHFQPPELSAVVIQSRTIGQGREAGAINGPNGRTWCVPLVIDWYADRLE